MCTRPLDRPSRAVLLRLSLVAVVMGMLACTGGSPASTGRPPVPQGGVAISFDDKGIASWAAAEDQLRPQFPDWTATFFVYDIDRLSTTQIEQLKYLGSKGHKIECHSLRHLNATDYLVNHSASDYVQEEVLPAVQGMQDRLGITPTFYAYPYGRHTAELDALLATRFKGLRGVSTMPLTRREFQVNPRNMQVFVLSRAIDATYDPDMNELDQALAYARDHGTVLLVTAHTVGDPKPGLVLTPLSTLQRICRFVQDNHMRFFTYSALYQGPTPPANLAPPKDFQWTTPVEEGEAGAPW